jgi:hypothetical protein
VTSQFGSKAKPKQNKQLKHLAKTHTMSYIEFQCEFIGVEWEEANSYGKDYQWVESRLHLNQQGPSCQRAQVMIGFMSRVVREARKMAVPLWSILTGQRLRSDLDNSCQEGMDKLSRPRGGSRPQPKMVEGLETMHSYNIWLKIAW